MPIYEFEDKRPVISRKAFIHPESIIIGDVEIGDEAYIGAGAVIRGDVGKIIIGSGSSVQDNCVLHADLETIAVIEDHVLIAHSAIVHGPCLIKQWAWVGQGANIVGNSKLGNSSILGAGSVLPPGQSIPARKIALGNPAKIIKDVTEDMAEKFREGSEFYQMLAVRCINSFNLIER